MNKYLKKKSALIPFTLTFISFSSISIHADTVGYWRFEDGAFLNDSSGNGLTLQNPTVSSSPTAGETEQLAVQASLGTVIGGVARGANFPNPIPQNGLANASMANLRPDTGKDPGYFIVDNDSGLTFSDITFEVFTNRQANSGNPMYFGSQWGDSNDSRSWTFRTNDSAGSVYISLSYDGQNVEAYDTGFDLPLATDYYLAFSFDLSNQTDGLVFYYQNLSDPEDTLHSIAIAHTLETLNNSAEPINIGTYNSIPNRTYKGVLDEVRISNSVLGVDELLISVPEPGEYALILGFVITGLVAVARRRTA